MIEGLYSASGPGVAKEIQEQLQAIQRQPQAWQIASQLLSVEVERIFFILIKTKEKKQKDEKPIKKVYNSQINVDSLGPILFK